MYSIRAAGQSIPQLLPVDSIDYQRRATLEWKKEQFNWGLLRGLLEPEE